jgi:hypothetical protein
MRSDLISEQERHDADLFGRIVTVALGVVALAAAIAWKISLQQVL